MELLTALLFLGIIVFVWSGVENGIYVTSYFRRIEGKWFLIKEEDFST